MTYTAAIGLVLHIMELILLIYHVLINFASDDFVTSPYKLFNILITIIIHRQKKCLSERRHSNNGRVFLDGNNS